VAPGKRLQAGEICTFNASGERVQTRQDGHIVKVERKIVHGTEQHVLERLEGSPSQTINTAYVERSNLEWRLWDAHLARKSPTAARSMCWLKAKFAICVACYNLIRPHETLSRGKDRIFRPKTPALRLWLQAWWGTDGRFLSFWPTPHYVNDMVTSPKFRRKEEFKVIREFNVVIERDEDGYFVASVPALRGCHTQAKSLDTLVKRIKEAIELCLEVEEPVSNEFVGVQRIAVNC